MRDTFVRPTLDLEDVGTRYKHLTDLQDIWASGVEALKQSYNRYPNKKDQLQLAQLEAAVKLLKIHMESVANWERKKWKLEEEIEKIPHPKPQKLLKAPAPEVESDPKPEPGVPQPPQPKADVLRPYSFEDTDGYIDEDGDENCAA